ncbi:MAG: Fic family protein [Deltaproteobacteria bacterium]|nr:Fic family protein [Deltaproteobacteria bacterium]
MKKTGRYETSGLTENRFEPGSRGRVLKNLLGIRRKSEMDRVEREFFLRTLYGLTKTCDNNHRFIATDIKHFHNIWLGDIYEWAGKYRRVNISKGDFPFAAAAHIQSLMEEFENGPLKRHTPCYGMNETRLIKALAEVHVELVLIHPFREGNGRIARILSTLMALQGGLPILDFNGISGKKKEKYFAAVRNGLDRDYGAMEEIFKEIIWKTFSASSPR